MEHRRTRGGGKVCAIAYVGLGSNLGDRASTLKRTLATLAEGGIPETRVVRSSRVYETRPLAASDGGPFLNAVAELETGLLPEVLLQALLELEDAHGRRREANTGARTLDLDLLAYVGDPSVPAKHWRLEMRRTEALRLPHPQLVHRDFVLAPLVEVAPEVRFDGEHTAAELLAALPERERTILRTFERAPA